MTSVVKYILLSVVILSYVRCSDAVSFKEDYLIFKYKNMQQLSPNYKIYWTVKQDELLLAMVANTTGWVGFGIAAPYTGGMGGASIVVGSASQTHVQIESRYAVGNSMPILSNCTNWVLRGGQQAGDTTILEVRRPLIATDRTHDQDIPSGNVEVIWAYGATDTFGYHGPVNRGPATVWFHGKEKDLLKGNKVKTMVLTMPNYTIPTTRTHYGCQSFLLPIDKERDIIGIEPIMDLNNPVGVHHFGLITCDSRDAWFDAHLDAQNCFMINGASAQTSCITNIYGGGSRNPGALILPADVGFRMGTNWFKYMFLQVHYDNRLNISGATDNSGVKIYYTEKLRRYPAGAMLIGDANIRGLPLDANSSHVERQFDCPVGCLSFLPQPITVFGLFNHMHMYGKQIYTAHKHVYPNGSVELIDYLGRNE